MHPLIHFHREQLLALAKRRGMTSVRVFGSVDRDNEGDPEHRKDAQRRKDASTGSKASTGSTLAFCLHPSQHDEIAAAIVGATRLAQLDDAVTALAVTLSPDDIAELQAPCVPHAAAGHA